MGILWFLLIGLIAGIVAGWLTGSGARGWIGTTLLGVAGSYLGGYLLPLVGIRWGGTIGSIATATIGAVVLVAIFSFVRKQMK